MNKNIIIFIIVIIVFRQLIFAETNLKDNTYINTTNIQYDEKNNIVELSKNSKINFENTNILIDRGIIDYNNDKIEVFGNFYLYQDFNILSGKDLIGKVKLDSFKANDVSYIYNNDFKIDSASAERSSNLITFHNNFLTPCEIDGYFNCPTWSLRINKTDYYIKEDKFIHFDTFLQIADYKIFYLPYFSHYGVKAPRKKGFLIPSIEFTIGGESGLKTPYYFPIGENADVTMVPTFKLNENLEFLESYNLNTIIKHKNSGGDTLIELDNIKNKNNKNINTSMKFKTSQVLNKKSIFSAKGLLTNSISTTRSINEDPLKYEDIYIKFEKFNTFSKNDYFKSELATVESYDGISNSNQIPLLPAVNYFNKYNINNKYSIFTNLDYKILKREKSNTITPSENSIINFNNFILFNKRFNNFYNFNKISSYNSVYQYSFEHNPLINRQENNNSIVVSSELNSNRNKGLVSRLKLIYFQGIKSSSDIINEDSNALSFNYTNQFSDKRFYGNDLLDNTSRIVYGFEKEIDIFEEKLKFNLNQSYDFNKNSNYAKKVNQKGNFSDYSLEFKTNFKKIDFKSDIRLNSDTLSRKEMNYSLDFYNPINLNLQYNETDSSAYSGVSDDTKSLGLALSKNINDNLIISYNSDLDIKNDYKPYQDSLKISLFDECSQLDVTYKNTRFNDNYNTSPEEKISVMFSMDYLGFFGYEQTTNLLGRTENNYYGN